MQRQRKESLSTITSCVVSLCGLRLRVDRLVCGAVCGANTIGCHDSKPSSAPLESEACSKDDGMKHESDKLEELPDIIQSVPPGAVQEYSDVLTEATEQRRSTVDGCIFNSREPYATCHPKANAAKAHAKGDLCSRHVSFYTTQ